MHKLSLHHLTMLDAHPLQLVDAAAAGNFDYCGLRIVAPTDADTIVDVAGNPALIREIVSRLSATGVRLLDIEAIWLQPSTRVDTLLPALEAARTLGAMHVLSVGNDEDRSRLIDNFGRLCEAAARLDMTVGLELITYCAVGTLPYALSVIKQSGQANARLLIDALQFFRSGAQTNDLNAIDSALIEYVQICDGPRVAPVSVAERRTEARTARLLPVDGELPVLDLVSRLRSDLTLSVEAPTRALQNLPFDEQARLISCQVRRFLEGSQIEK
jgi:sugar phosphate isomerase/epimerase